MASNQNPIEEKINASQMSNKDEPELQSPPIKTSKTTTKPAWVEKYGNISQIISAGSAVLFGLSAAFISLQIAKIQSENILTQELARDRDVLGKLITTIRSDELKWSSSFSCAKVLVAVKPDTPPMMVKCGQENGGLLCPSNPALNFQRRNCGEEDSIQIFEKSKYFFDLINRSLVAWRPDISPLRKEVYYKDLSEVCNDPLYELPKTNIYAKVRYSHLTDFIKECDNLIKDFDRGPNTSMLPVSNFDDMTLLHPPKP